MKLKITGMARISIIGSFRSTQQWKWKSII